MTYRVKGQAETLTPGAGITASISWEAAAGTAGTPTTTALANSAGETWQIDATTVASGTEIPAYNCTLNLQFTNTPTVVSNFADNDLTWTCTTTAVPVTCKYRVGSLWCFTIQLGSGHFDAYVEGVRSVDARPEGAGHNATGLVSTASH